MQTFFATIEAIHQQTRELDNEHCPHCGACCLVSHGFCYKQISILEFQPVGKRVLCANRRGKCGCGRTVRLYLASRIPRLQSWGWQVVSFVWALLAGWSIAEAYWAATGAVEPRQGYRWFKRLMAQLVVWRPQVASQGNWRQIFPSSRYALLAESFVALTRVLGMPLCSGFQLKFQQAFC